MSIIGRKGSDYDRQDYSEDDRRIGLYSVPKIKELNLTYYYEDGDSVDSSLNKIEDKINEIIEFLNKR